MTYLLQALVACATTYLLILWMRGPAERFGLIDHPGGRKRHDVPTPLTGGLAITISLFVALSFSLSAMGSYHALLAAVVVLAVIGLLDDRGKVFPRTKLGVQVLAAVLMTSLGNHFLHSLGDLFGRGPVDLMNWAIPLTVFATVAVINAINTFDGVDGLAGTLVLAILAYFAFFAWSVGDANALKFLVVLIGALVGFLVFNVPLPWASARSFMGDTGSQVLGIVVAWFSIEFTQETTSAIPPVCMLWVVGVILLDFFTVTMRRVIRRRNPATPDRAHIHHLLMRRGFSPMQTVLILALVNITFGAIGTAGWLLGWPQHLMFAGFLAAGILYFGIFLFPARFMRLGRRSRQAPRLAEAQKGAGWGVATPGEVTPAEPLPLLDQGSRPALRQSPHRASRRRRPSGVHSRPPGA
ncbi:MAG TPA: MraY family glycosyltransferase [Burkholderiaceae bacterium]|nr:MraY family glycosyltransferase [Burkholderiaceae bacterium]